MRTQGIKVGLVRPITLWPFPTEVFDRLSQQVKGMLVVELNAGQMIEDVKLASQCRVPVHHYGRLGGIVPNLKEISEAFFNSFPDAKK